LTFKDLYLSPALLARLDEIGYETPTPVQAKAIPIILQGRDLLACAQTGTGKTAAYVLPILDILAEQRSRAMMPRCIILLPTRELALQVEASFKEYGQKAPLKVALIIGGVSMGNQEQALAKGVDVVIATPGRFLDLHGRGKVLLMDANVLVIDEADRLLDMGFMPDVQKIVDLLPKTRQTIFLSATMPGEIQKLTETFLNNPKEIKISPVHKTGETITQYLVFTTNQKKEIDAQKRQVLRDLLTKQNIKNAIIFCNRKRDVDVLQRSLERSGYKARGLHGDMPQSTRTEVLAQFKEGGISFLIASDIAARGVDVVDMPHVINYDVPHNSEDYIHRIGRTGRAGCTGHAWTLVCGRDQKAIQLIEQMTQKTIPYLEGFTPQDHHGETGEKAPTRPAKKAEIEVKKSEAPKPMRGTKNPEAPKVSREPQHKVATVENEPAAAGFGKELPAFMRIAFPK